MKETECKKGILRAKTDGGPPKAGRRTGFNENRLRKNLFIVGMLSIAIVHFLVFWLYVNLSSILMAFKNVTIEGTKWGFGNFKIMFDSFRNPTSELRGAFVNTMIFFAVNLFIKLPLTFICSYFLYKKIKGYKYYRFVFFLPSIISAVVLTSLLKYMVNPGGPLPRIYEMLWGREAPLFLADSDYALGGFLDAASREPWFDNTVFVITADHCASSAGKTEIPLEKYHIPAMIYAPAFVASGSVGKTASQIDLMPTLFSLLGMDYDSWFYGRDILADDFRERAFVATYQDLGYLEGDRFTVLSPVDRAEQFLLRPTDDDPYALERTEAIDSTHLNRAISLYQTSSQWNKR